MPKRAPFTVLGVVIFWIYPPLEFPFSATPPPKGVRRTLHRECFQCPRSVRVDLKSRRGGGGAFFAKRGGSAAGICRPIRPSPRSLAPPSKLIEQTRVAPLPLRVTSGGGGREVLLNPVDETSDRGLERLGILTLVFL